MDPINTEICSNCGREIARLEQAYIFEGNIVCAECDLQLRSGPLPESAAVPEPITAPEQVAAEPVTISEPLAASEQQPEEPKLQKTEEQNKESQSQDADKPIGFIIAGVVLSLLGVGLIIISLVGLAASLFLGLPQIGMLMAGGCATFGMLILIAGIAAIVVAVISRHRLPR